MASSAKVMFLAIACVLSIKAVDCKSVKVVTWEDEEDPSKTDFLNNLIEAESEENDIQGEGPNSIGFNGGRFPHYHEPNPDIHLTTPELIERHGFPAEIHHVTTADGYVLTVHRIPCGKKNIPLGRNREAEARPVVFLQHGMFGTSADWIINAEQKSLAYMLVEAGYDVWLGNARGNQYSQAHETLSIKRIKFWRFSWDEMGRFDLPAVIDYVLNATGKEKLSYIGHSMGTTMFFVLLSTKPEYNTKVNFMGALGPAVYLKQGTSPAHYLAEFYGRAEKIILDIIGHGVFFPKFVARTLRFIGPEFCTEVLKIDELCEDAMFLLAGHDPAQTNYTQFPVILAHVPSTVSTQTGFHYFQIIKSGEFTMYDHGKLNTRIYGKKKPPKYDLSNVRVPVAIFWGQNDIICDPLDVAQLVIKLPNVTLNHRVEFPEFNHIDFIFAKDADVLVNKPLLDALGKHN